MVKLKNIFSRSKSDQRLNNIETISTDEDFTKIIKSDKLFFIYFNRHDCKNCLKTNKIINEVINYFNEKDILFLSLTPDLKSNLKIYKKYNIRYTPRFMICKGNEILEKESEIINNMHIIELLEKFQKKI
ncbi:hypothetical protein CPAV1605_1490 [seawater metagenome]|uniref:Uncharacterized protein n=1 Tax=seawater metagenome TaxID=1561972 RepID=A0A5E8CLC9_9ZZZZ